MAENVILKDYIIQNFTPYMGGSFPPNKLLPTPLPYSIK